MLDAYIAQNEEKSSQLRSAETPPGSEGERFVNGLGRTVYHAMLEYLRRYRAEIATKTAQAAE